MKYKHKTTNHIAELTTNKIYSSKDDNNFYYHLPASIVENSCDWEKVEEYEILSFRCIDKYNENYNELALVKGNIVSWEKGGGDASLQRILEVVGTFQEIYSIKRLSDQEVFTIGDKITGEYFSEPRTIKSFFIKCGELKINQDFGESTLSSIEKATPILITEDKVSLFEGDNYWFIWINNPAHGHLEFTPYFVKVTKLERNESWSTNTKYFSTKQAAQKWIEDFRDKLIKITEKKKDILDLKKIKELQDIPCLSINDVAKVYVTANRYRNNGNLEPLYDFDKQGRELIALVQKKTEKSLI